MIKKVDEDNEGTNQMNVSESENTENTLEKLNDTVRKNTNNESSKILG